jgi:hypothetical protein
MGAEMIFAILLVTGFVAGASCTAEDNKGHCVESASYQCAPYVEACRLPRRPRREKIANARGCTGCVVADGSCRGCVIADGSGGGGKLAMHEQWVLI